MLRRTTHVASKIARIRRADLDGTIALASTDASQLPNSMECAKPNRIYPLVGGCRSAERFGGNVILTRFVSFFRSETMFQNCPNHASLVRAEPEIPRSAIPQAAR